MGTVVDFKFRLNGLSISNNDIKRSMRMLLHLEELCVAL